MISYNYPILNQLNHVFLHEFFIVCSRNSLITVKTQWKTSHVDCAFVTSICNLSSTIHSIQMRFQWFINTNIKWLKMSSTATWNMFKFHTQTLNCKYNWLHHVTSVRVQKRVTQYNVWIENSLNWFEHYSSRHLIDITQILSWSW